MKTKELEWTKDESGRWILKELSAFLKECPNCKQKFKDFLDNRIVCINCEREQKLKELGL